LWCFGLWLKRTFDTTPAALKNPSNTRRQKQGIYEQR